MEQRYYKDKKDLQTQFDDYSEKCLLPEWKKLKEHQKNECRHLRLQNFPTFDLINYLGIMRQLERDKDPVYDRDLFYINPKRSLFDCDQPGEDMDKYVDCLIKKLEYVNKMIKENPDGNPWQFTELRGKISRQLLTILRTHINLTGNQELSEKASSVTHIAQDAASSNA